MNANPPYFHYARARGRAKWPHKLCAESVRDTNRRNYLKESFMYLYHTRYCKKVISHVVSIIWRTIRRQCKIRFSK